MVPTQKILDPRGDIIGGEASHVIKPTGSEFARKPGHLLIEKTHLCFKRCAVACLPETALVTDFQIG